MIHLIRQLVYSYYNQYLAVQKVNNWYLLIKDHFHTILDQSELFLSPLSVWITAVATPCIVQLFIYIFVSTLLVSPLCTTYILKNHYILSYLYHLKYCLLFQH